MSYRTSHTSSHAWWLTSVQVGYTMWSVVSWFCSTDDVKFLFYNFTYLSTKTTVDDVSVYVCGLQWSHGSRWSQQTQPPMKATHSWCTASLLEILHRLFCGTRTTELTRSTFVDSRWSGHLHWLLVLHVVNSCSWTCVALWCSSVVERWSLTGELFLACTWPAADG